MRLELGGKRLMRPVVLGDHDKAARVLVDAMNDARPLDAADAGKRVAAMGEEAVDERIVRVPGGRVHRKSGRLVDDDDVGVLVDDVKVHLPREARHRRRIDGRRLRFDAVARANLCRRACQNFAVSPDRALSDQLLDARARPAVQAIGEHLVEPSADVFR